MLARTRFPYSRLGLPSAPYDTRDEVLDFIFFLDTLATVRCLTQSLLVARSASSRLRLCTRLGVFALRAVCMRTVCRADENGPQTGVGRTGKMWGYQNFEVEPDVITSAKVRGLL